MDFSIKYSNIHYLQQSIHPTDIQESGAYLCIVLFFQVAEYIPCQMPEYF